MEIPNFWCTYLLSFPLQGRFMLLAPGLSVFFPHLFLALGMKGFLCAYSPCCDVGSYPIVSWMDGCLFLFPALIVTSLWENREKNWRSQSWYHLDGLWNSLQLQEGFPWGAWIASLKHCGGWVSRLPLTGWKDRLGSRTWAMMQSPRWKREE